MELSEPKDPRTRKNPRTFIPAGGARRGLFFVFRLVQTARVDWKRAGLFLLLSRLVCGVPALQAAQSSRPLVISYLISPEPDSIADYPDEVGSSNMPSSHRWNWRVYDPQSKRDTLFLKLRFVPWNLRWDPLFTQAEFVYGKRIVRVKWRMGERIEEIARIPSDSCLCDFWHDDTGGLHLVTQREVPVNVDGRLFTANVGTRWDYDHALRTWHVAVIDSAAGGHYGECVITARMMRGAKARPIVRVGALLESMRVDPERATKLSDDTHGSKQSVEWLWLPSVRDSMVGLEMGGGFGDSFHGEEPVIWVDRRHGKRKTIYPIGSSGDLSAGQIGFAERRGKLLIASEYNGGYPAVFDMTTGIALLRVSQNSARAVWVPAPR